MSGVLRFCGHCGSALERREIDERQRGACPACGWVDYQQLKVGVGALVASEDRLLLIRRATEPFAGCWSLPAGYVDVDEPPIAAVIREVREEVGLDVTVRGLAGVYYFDDDPRGNGILIAFDCSQVSGSLVETHEALAPTFLTREEVPQDLAGAGHDQAIRAWVAADQQPFRRHS